MTARARPMRWWPMARDGDARLAIWGVTVQNEPDAQQRRDWGLHGPKDEREVARDDLGPVLQSAGPGRVRTAVWHHNRCPPFTFCGAPALAKPAAGALHSQSAF